jgi:hypothetical protein
MTGSMDGIVRFWSIRYVQVAEQQQSNKRGNKNKGGNKLLLAKSSEDDDEEDSSLVTEEEIDSEGEEVKVNPLLEQQQPDKDLLAVDIIDPDKDRDSLEDVHEAVKTEGVKNCDNSSSAEMATTTSTQHGVSVLTSINTSSPPIVIRRQNRRDRLHSDTHSPGYEYKNFMYCILFKYLCFIKLCIFV